MFQYVERGGLEAVAKQLAVELHYFDRRRYEHAARTLDEIGRLIGGWAKAHMAASMKPRMAKRHDHLFTRIAAFGALHRAARRAILGKRRKPGAAAFFANLEGELLRLERQLLAGSYVTIEVHDPKRRLVSAAPFRDRVVHHALCAVIEPIFEAGFIDHSFANRKGKGTHRANVRHRTQPNLLLRRISAFTSCEMCRLKPKRLRSWLMESTQRCRFEHDRHAALSAAQAN
jgi:hypothetical protein